MTDPTGLELFVLYSPEGSRRVCTSDEAGRALLAWTSLLRWLRGDRPDELPESEVVGHVARTSALRIPRHPEYDIGLWVRQARGLDRVPGSGDIDGRTLADVVGHLLASIDLRRADRQRCRLSPAVIEALYGRQRSFQRNRHAVVRHLLDGPVSIERWTGPRLELALASKFVARRILSTEAAVNLVHLEITTAARSVQVMRETADVN
ncbi:hypothetical protein GCM10022251_29950 [Phytohabitans flavus]|uniref:Uncharacterized protein n=1 Tax=Phytohabitans flavus TaxID=1076124 RepID=A0A6F8XX69_9ACTN|nr:hypothetical protein [Phytohabitans flavus]BCB78425.1 hypothetical protein Pflav_048350 [Phytohabitans flavus]